MRAMSRQSHSSSISIIGPLHTTAATLPKERFESGVTDHMICLICQLVSTDPCYLVCCHNHFYCYKCIIKEKKDASTIVCPSCTIPVKVSTLTRCDNLRKAIFALKTVICVYSGSGCTTLSTIQTISSHVDGCEFQPTPCENRGCKEVCLLKDWVWHCKVKCSKRKTRCVGNCKCLLAADEIDTHDCGHVVKEFLDYRRNEVETLGVLFKKEAQSVMDLEDRVHEWHQQKEFDRIARSFSAMKVKLMLKNADDELHDPLGHSVHHGKWRCSVLDCTIPYEKHDYSNPFPDGHRHIFFWDCCLNDSKDTVNCDLFED